MPILQNLTITPGAAVAVSIPSFTISVQITTNDGRPVADYTGPNAIQFPADLAKVPQARRDRISRLIAQAMIAHLAGVVDEP